MGFGPPPPAYAPYPAPYPPPSAVPSPPQAPPGPDFLAADRHNSVVVDGAGVSFEMGGMTADFPWQVIRGVHYRPGPGDKALIVTVVHVDGRMYQCGVSAKPRERLREWFGQLAAVLGHYRPTG